MPKNKTKKTMARPQQTANYMHMSKGPRKKKTVFRSNSRPAERQPSAVCVHFSCLHLSFRLEASPRSFQLAVRSSRWSRLEKRCECEAVSLLPEQVCAEGGAKHNKINNSKCNGGKCLTKRCPISKSD